MSRERLRQVPSNLTGELGQYLSEVWNAVNGIPTSSYFSGTSPNSVVTGVAGNLAVNVGMSSTDSRFWIKGGNAVIPSRTDWVTIGSGGVTIPPADTLTVVDTIAALKALASPATAVTYLVRGYYTAGDGGGGLYRWDSASSATDNGGTYLRPDSAPATGRWKLLHSGIVYAAQFGAKASQSGAVNTLALQKCWDFIEDEGGEMVLEPRVVYPCGNTLDFRVAVSREYARSIRGMGATLDFSAAGHTSGNLVTVGATELAFSPERTWNNIGDFRIIGPEDNDDMEPRLDTNAFDAVAATTVHGLKVMYGVGLNLRNIDVARCYMGLEYFTCWSGVWENLRAYKCILGHYLDAGLTWVIGNRLEATSCTHAFVIQYGGAGASIGDVTLNSPRVEDCTIGFHLDQGTADVQIESVHITDPYFEDVYGDHFRVGIAFDSTPANWATRGADRAGRIAHFCVEGGTVTGAGDSTNWGANRKAFAFASTRNVAYSRIIFPCNLADIVNRPHHLSFRSMILKALNATQLIEVLEPGSAIAGIGAGGEETFVQGNITDVTAVSTGLYDVNFTKAYQTADHAVAVVVSRDASRYAAIDDANSSTTKARVQMRTDAGVLTDAQFHIIVNGQLAAL